MHIKANAATCPESALLLHRECIFSGKMLMDHNATNMIQQLTKNEQLDQPPWQNKPSECPTMLFNRVSPVPNNYGRGGN
jgi:hypothetical protein